MVMKAPTDSSMGVVGKFATGKLEARASPAGTGGLSPTASPDRRYDYRKNCVQTSMAAVARAANEIAAMPQATQNPPNVLFILCPHRTGLLTLSAYPPHSRGT